MPTNVSGPKNILLTLTMLSAATLTAAAQSINYMQSQAAPIERNQQSNEQYTQQPVQTQRPRIKHSQPAQGVWLSVSPDGNVTTVAATADRTELRIDSGIANIVLHHPNHGSMILVDLAGGQIDLIKDGFYTFNAETKTVRTLVGEAEAFNSLDGNSGAKPLKIKENHSLSLGFPTLKSVDFQPFQASSDVLPRNNTYANNDGGYGAGYGPGYGYGPYGDSFYGGYPYYAFGYGYPYGYGYPCVFPYRCGYGYGYGRGYYGRGFYGRGYGGRGFHGGYGGRGFGGGRGHR